ncbi:MAG: O-antigen ligase family protein [Chloroflexi bacterium]|nr:O-antigen ligase family protein [Chloroflexota bacterium]
MLRKTTTLSGLNNIYTPLQQSPLLSVSLPILLCLMVGLLTAVLIAEQEWVLLAMVVVPVLLVPFVKLLLTQPFTAVLLWLLLYPIFFKISGPLSRYTDWFLHYTLIPATIPLILFAMLLGFKQRHELKIGVPDLAMLLFLLLGFVNIMVLTPNPERTLVKFYFQIIIPFAFYWLIRIVKPQLLEFRYLAWIAIPVLLIQSSVGLLSWFAPALLPDFWLSRANARTTGTVGNPAVFTVILIFCAMLFFHYAIHARSRNRQIAFLLLVGLAFFSVFFSFSRGSWLGGILVWTGLLVVYPRLARQLTFLVLLCCIPLALTLLTDQVTWARDRLATEETVEGRLLGGNATWGLIQAKPWFGWGYDTHELYDEQFRTRVLNLAVNKEHSSHQTYLLIAAEMGVVGLVIYMFPVGWWLVKSGQNWRYLPRSGFLDRRLMMLLWLVMLQYFVVSNFTEMIHSNYVGTTIWWLTLGLIANLAESRASVDAPTSRDKNYHSSRTWA